MNRTLLDECFRFAGRTTWYVEVSEIQRDLDRFIEYYNLQRSHATGCMVERRLRLFAKHSASRCSRPLQGRRSPRRMLLRDLDPGVLVSGNYRTCKVGELLD